MRKPSILWTFRITMKGLIYLMVVYGRKIKARSARCGRRTGDWTVAP